ncbi:MAG: 16S rRNA (adenine(1518)-N(6)/adenine(1519)-N(6))-dimethyltransferase RsmA [Gammaproteobacteria bacterium]|nr:16S rRNA (adenine(1518)-N(6)/adenine(1519)-N(6))-dimethyltransferase RsmA [Gammaproteobacteria bacterium]
MTHRPRKRFGQNFLHDPAIIDAIIDTVDASPATTVVEIGPGLGALTLPLLETGCDLHIIELDRDLVMRWESQQEKFPHLTVHQGDALKFDFDHLAPDHTLHLVGNLPYNISTPLLFHFLRFSQRFEVLHVMLQKEVAERICAPPGSKTYGRLSVMLAVHFASELLFEIPPHAFTPAPKVTSAFLRLQPRQAGTHGIIDANVFATLVRQAFSQRRKTLGKSLRGLLDRTDFEMCDIDPCLRPEALPVDAFVQLANRLTQKPDTCH